MDSCDVFEQRMSAFLIGCKGQVGWHCLCLFHTKHFLSLYLSLALFLFSLSLFVCLSVLMGFIEKMFLSFFSLSLSLSLSLSFSLALSDRWSCYRRRCGVSVRRERG